MKTTIKKVLYISIIEFVSVGGELRKERELYKEDGTLLGYYLDYDIPQKTHLMSNASYKSFPFADHITYVKVLADVSFEISTAPCHNSIKIA